jgi:hypothetical protein
VLSDMSDMSDMRYHLKVGNLSDAMIVSDIIVILKGYIVMYSSYRA